MKKTKKILVLYQDWNDWFIKDYAKFKHWFNDKDGAYDKNNKYYILSLGNYNKKLHPEKNVKVELFKSSPTKQIFDLIKFKSRLTKIINEFKPDYIYSPFLYLLATVPKGNYKTIGFLRDITAEMVKSKGGLKKFVGNIFYILDYLAFRNIDTLMYNSPYLKNYALKMKYNKKLIFAPRNIIDKEFLKDANPQEIIKKYGINNKKIIITVARLTKEKNIEMGIKALKYMPQDYTYMIIGEGREKENLKKLAKKLDIHDRVFFIGFVNHKELWKYYKTADVLWLLSKSNFEGIPNVILEAWYSKVPIIVSKIDALSSIIDNNTTGIILNTWDEKELAIKTHKLINNKKQINVLVENGLKKVNEITKKHVDVKELFL